MQHHVIVVSEQQFKTLNLAMGSFSRNKKFMEEGDTVLLYLGYDNLVQVELKSGSVHQNRFGAIKHDQLIGAPYGVKIECPKGWVCPLQPTAELWTLALPHRTQILYTPDISMIVLQLHLKPGSVVAEAGTGSGSLSHALIRSIMPAGKLHTFEFHEDRCKAVSDEFERHGLADFVIAKHQDVCTKGFGLVNEVDAVFLDLPKPWECVDSAKQALQPGGRICSFSPCMEQVQRTCEALTKSGFSDITTLECLARPFSFQNVKLPIINFGDQEEETSSNSVGNKTLSSSDSAKVAKVMSDNKGEKEESKMDVEGEVPGENLATVQESTVSSGVPVSAQVTNRARKIREFETGAPPVVMQGHTGFLTFASLY